MIKQHVSHSKIERRELRNLKSQSFELTDALINRDSALYIASCKEVRPRVPQTGLISTADPRYRPW